MKIATFNANGIRARLSLVLKWLATESPDILCLQETKVQDADFPAHPFEEMAYHCIFRGQKSYNGVAILSKSVPEKVSFGFGDGDSTEEPRLVSASVCDISIVNTYVPQGYTPDSDSFQHKLKWLQRLQDHFSRNFSPEMMLIWAGDFNIAPEPIDVFDPEKLSGSVGFHPEEHKALAAIKTWGLVDVFRRHESAGQKYSFWDYRIPEAVNRGLGWRLDHIWATQGLAEKSTRSWIDVAPRLSEKPSDHTFVVADFDVELQ
jgi:exodeoxyribonuclease-3